MKILFVLNTPGFLRYFDVTIDALLERGHSVALAFTRPDLRPESLEIYDDRARRPDVLGQAPNRGDRYASTATAIRAAVDYVRYLDPGYADAEYLRTRRRTTAFQLAPALRLLGMRRSLPRPLARALERTLLALERAVPSAPDIEEYLSARGPDVVVVSPLVSGASPQTDYVKSARALGIPCALCVASWDNLTNKGLMREVPDRVMVWNATQRDEAVRLHGVAPERVLVTGAHPFDRWFGRAPSGPREAFCARVGLSPQEPFVMFVGSTSNISRAGVEERFVRTWIEALRADARLANVGVLVRPHPDRPGAWDDLDLAGLPNVAVWPPRAPNAIAAETRADYFDSLYHAAAVVGVNTSAMIEAALIGRPVLTVRSQQFAEAHEGTIHFRYLLPEHGGFVIAASGLGEHVEQLSEAIREPERTQATRQRFVDAFIRPHGRDEACNDHLVAALEELALLRPDPVRARNPVLAAVVAAAAARSRRRATRLARASERTRRHAVLAAEWGAGLGGARRPAARLVRAGAAGLYAYDRLSLACLRRLEARRELAQKSIRKAGKAHERQLLAREVE